MALGRVHHNINTGAIHALLTSPQGPVGRDMYRRGQNVRSAAVREVGVDTGRLRADIGVELVQRNGLPAARVGSGLGYARVHHEGHGVIVPVRAKMLAWRSKKSGRMVFAKKVRAVPGNPFLVNALRAARR